MSGEGVGRVVAVLAGVVTLAAAAAGAPTYSADFAR
jgi:hypothetical protein